MKYLIMSDINTDEELNRVELERVRKLKFGTTIPSKCLKIALGDLGGLWREREYGEINRKKF